MFLTRQKTLSFQDEYLTSHSLVFRIRELDAEWTIDSAFQPELVACDLSRRDIIYDVKNLDQKRYQLFLF